MSEKKARVQSHCFEKEQGWDRKDEFIDLLKLLEKKCLEVLWGVKTDKVSHSTIFRKHIFQAEVKIFLRQLDCIDQNCQFLRRIRIFKPFLSDWSFHNIYLQHFKHKDKLFVYLLWQQAKVSKILVWYLLFSLYLINRQMCNSPTELHSKRIINLQITGISSFKPLPL